MQLTRFTVGDTLDQYESVSGYPSTDGWSLVHKFIPTSGTGIITTTGTSQTDGRHRTHAAPTVSATWAAGNYGWTSYVTNGTDRASVGTGFIVFAADPATTTSGADTRTHSRKCLDAIEATIEGRATHDMSMYMIAGRQVSMLSPDELIKWRAYYKTQVAAEERRQTGLSRRSGIRVKFR